MKKLLLISLIFILVFSFAITGLAKVKLIYWSCPYYSVPDKESGWYERRVMAEFMELYPEVEIELQMLPWGAGSKVNIAIATGTPPDILNTSDTALFGYAVAGVISDMEDTMDAEEQADFFPAALDRCKLDGKVFMYPLVAVATGFEFNRFIAEKAGAMDLLPLDREDRSWTHEEFKKFCLKIAEAKIPDTYAFTFHFGGGRGGGCQHYVKQMIQSCGVDPFEKDVDGKYKIPYKCVINSQEAVEGVQWWLDLYNTPGVGMPGCETTDYNYYTDFWYGGKLACSLEGGAALSLMNARKDPEVRKKLDYILVGIPYKEGVERKNITFIGMQGIGAFKSTPEKEKYAKLYCEFFATRPYLWETTIVACPPRKGTFDLNSPYYQKSPFPLDNIHINWINKWSEYMVLVDVGQNCPIYRQYLTNFGAAMQGIFTGELTPREGLDMVAERTNKQLDEYYEENPVK